jgi:hypothetical protein
VKPRLALSFDIEATGDIPTMGSMVMLGIVAVLEGTKAIDESSSSWIVSSIQVCLEEDYPRDEECWDEFWSKHQDVWKFIQDHKVPPKQAMSEIGCWLKTLSETYDWYWVAMPASYDWMWLKMYYEKYSTTWRSVPIGKKAECMKGYRHVASLQGKLTEFTAFTTPKTLVHTHYAIEDAKEQAWVFLRSQEFYKC